MLISWIKHRAVIAGPLNPCLRGLATSSTAQAQAQTQMHEMPATTSSFVAAHDSSSYFPKFQALLVDAAGTLLNPSEPAAEVYVRYAKKHNVPLTERDALLKFREAYNMPYVESTIRYVGDARPFWRHIVKHSTGSDNQDLFEDIYEYYARGEAWTVSPGALESLERIRRTMKIKTAVVSNFDTRLRRIMSELNINHVFDTVIVSAEIGVEKPNPILFSKACEALGVSPEHAVHVGDDRRNDLFGARDAGCFAWLWGQDVHNFAEVERRLETRNYFDSLHNI